MADVLVPIAIFFGVPFVIFVLANWKKEQREREQRRHVPPPDQVDLPTDLYRYWGGTGRPGR